MPPVREQVEQAYERLREIVRGDSPSTAMLSLRQILEAIYKKLTEESKTSFGSLFARTQFAHTELDFPRDLVAQVNQLRILCNKVAHESAFHLAKTDYHSSLLALRNLLQFLEPEISDPGLELFLEQVGAKPFPPFEARPKRSFFCVALDWKLHTDANGLESIEIRAADEEGFDCSILLNDLEAEGRRWSRLDKILWRYCTLNCLNLTEVTGRQRCFQSNPLTLIVVEPDFLIDATSVAECFTNRGARPEFFVINRLIRDAASEKILQGTLINHLLDELVSAPDTDYQTLFQRALAKQPISLVALGLSATLNIYNTIQSDHFDRIREFAASLAGDTVQLEPSYISPQYGLQGRLDILRLHEGKYHIVELKSGSAPRREVWIGHQMQVVAYNMLIRGCYPRKAIGNSSIFYSAADTDSFRHVTNTIQMEAELLLCRNRIVGIMHGLALDPSVFFNWLRATEFQPDSGFMQENFQSVLNTLNQLPDYQYAWFLEQVRLLVREIWFEKTGGLAAESIYGHNALWQESPTAKKNRYRLLDSLIPDQVDFNRIRFRLGGSAGVTDFRIGDIVVLYRQAKAVQKQEILRGQIVELGPETLTVQIRGGLRRLDSGTDSGLWALEHDILETSLYSPLSSLFTFLRAPLRRRELFLGLARPETEADPPPGSSELDGVINRVLASREFHIVQGPPGTGKTSGLLAGYLKALHKGTSANVLILSFTNRAVDEICLNLRKHQIPFIRTGHSDDISTELMENLVAGKRYEEMEQVLRGNRIWVATVQSCNAWLGDLLKLLSLDQIIIDEASQIVENSILGIISQAPKTVLIGDQNQLPPITRQGSERFTFSHPSLTGLAYGFYSQSLMERLFKVCQTRGWNDSCSMLQRHFRMHEDIAGLIQPFYGGQLLSAVERQTAPLAGLSHPLLASRLVWIGFPPSRNAFYDPLQVKAVVAILEIFSQYGIVEDPARDIGIVTPFRAMIHALQAALPPAFQSVTIDTVERFQGSERQHIVLALPLHVGSVLRNIEAVNGEGTVDRKLNVAVSRAQERLIVLGCPELCRRSVFYNLLLDKIAASGKVFPYNELIQE